MTKEERIALWPGTLFCEDFYGIGSCCAGLCHDSLSNLITVYPESCYSVKHKDKMPELTFGLHGEVCCGRYEAVRALPRDFWIRLLGKRQGWTAAHIEQLAAAPPETYFRVRGEIESHYTIRSSPTVRPSGVVGGRMEPLHSRGTTSRKTSLRGTGVSFSKCPSCGQRWNGDACENCGHGAGI